MRNWLIAGAVIVVGIGALGAALGSSEKKSGPVPITLQAADHTVETPKVRVAGHVPSGTKLQVDTDAAFGAQNVPLDGNGDFAIMVALQPGSNNVTFTASNSDYKEQTEKTVFFRRNYTAAEKRQIAAREAAAERRQKIEQQRQAARERAAAERRRQQRAAAAANFKSSAVTIPYNQLEKDADSYAGKKVRYRGQIFQIQQSGGTTIILLAVTYDSTLDMWDDNIWVDYNGTIKSAKDDVITVYGTVTGSKSYETQIGGETYVPQVQARYIDEGG